MHGNGCEQARLLAGKSGCSFFYPFVVLELVFLMEDKVAKALQHIGHEGFKIQDQCVIIQLVYNWDGPEELKLW